jgi:hypothetical protein
MKIAKPGAPSLSSEGGQLGEASPARMIGDLSLKCRSLARACQPPEVRMVV